MHWASSFVLLSLSLCSCGAVDSQSIEERVLKVLDISQQDVTQLRPHIWQLRDGRIVYSSKPYGKDICGYSGTTPVYIVVSNNVIQSVIPATNSEEAAHFRMLDQHHLFDTWKGMTLSQAADARIDIVTGATYSSQAIIQTVATTAHKVKDKDPHANSHATLWYSCGIALLTALSGFLYFKRKKHNPIKSSRL